MVCWRCHSLGICYLGVTDTMVGQQVRLDRVLMNINFLNAFSKASVSYLARSSFDHSPMVIKLARDNVCYGFPSFKFQQMWVSHELFFDCVVKSWQTDLV